ncbi:MAG TPA: cation:proton antiporter, partial [Planctomycetaceae bacterium]|nr:cation:proton antiporter [Planctomycetaceae bacterium]
MNGTSNRGVAWRWIAVAVVLLVWPGALGITGTDGAAREEAIAATAEEAADGPLAGAEGEQAAAAPDVGSETAGEQTEPSEHAAGGAEHGGGHADPVGPVLLGVVIIILAARIGGHLFELAGQPAVLGELVIGVVLGNLTLVGITQLEFLKVDYSSGVAPHGTLGLAGVTIDHLSRIGVVLLLFQVGLETSVNEMRRVGLSAFLVALLGVVAPIGLGWACGAVLLPEHHWTVHMYLGATLAATSVGITARVLQDLGKQTTKEAQIILGAAVIDDVMGLVVLAAAQGIITALNNPAGGEFGAAELIATLAKAVG